MATTSAPTAHHRPWLPTSLGFATLVVALLAWQLLPSGPPKDEPQPDRPVDAPVEPVDPAVTASLVSFLESSGDLAPSRAEVPEFKRGIALGLYSQSLDYDYGMLIDEIADHEAGWISLFFNMYQDNRTSTEMQPMTRLADQEAMLARAAQKAHRQGLQVMAFPLVLLTHAGPREWRGNLEPDDVDAWFENYGNHILRLARVCEREGIDSLCVGSEFSSLEQYELRWRSLVAEVRGVFSGEVIYSANWDHYRKVPFWDAVDAIGLSGYYELTKSKEPKLEDLTREWNGIQNHILRWKAEQKLEIPLLFTEIGYANLDGTNIYPWDYTLKGEPDPNEQALCYEAFMRVWHGQPGFGGVFFYNWFGFDTLDDTGYSPRGKPAAELIRTWYLALKPDEPPLTGH